MQLFLQALTAFFAVIGLFETVWQTLLFFTRRSVRGQRARILVETDESTDPAFLQEDLRLMESRFLSCKDTLVWLICPPGAPQESVCRFLAERDPAIRIIRPEDLNTELQAFRDGC